MNKTSKEFTLKSINGIGGNNYGKHFQITESYIGVWSGGDVITVIGRAGENTIIQDTTIDRDGGYISEPFEYVFPQNSNRIVADNITREWSTISSRLNGLSDDEKQELRMGIEWIASSSEWRVYNSQFGGGYFNSNTSVSATGLITPIDFSVQSNSNSILDINADTKQISWWGGALSYLNGTVKYQSPESMYILQLLYESIELGEYEVSEHLKEWLKDNKGDNPSANNVQWKVYCSKSSFLGAEKITDVNVQWSNDTVNNHLLGYDEHNAIIHLSVLPFKDVYRPERQIQELVNLKYGELTYKTTMSALQNAVGISIGAEIFDTIIPIGSASDVALLMQMEYSDATFSSLMFAQIPYNTTQGTSYLQRGYFPTENNKDGSSVNLEIVDNVPGVPLNIPGWNLDAYDNPFDDLPQYDFDVDDTEPYVGHNTNIGLLTRSFAISESQLQNLGGELWSGDFAYRIDAINSSPIQNIISVKSFPFNINGGTEQNIPLGNVSMSARGKLISGSYSPKKTIGTFTIPKKFINENSHLNWLNYAPYTSASIYLPYCGFHDLPINEIIGKTCKVEYIYDIICGTCIATIKANDVEIVKYSGQIAIDIPITSSNRAQVEMSYVTNGISAVAGAIGNLATRNVGGAISSLVGGGLNALQTPFQSQTNGSPSPSTDAFDDQNVFIIVNYPVYYEPSGYGRTFGYPCNLSKKLSKLKGWTVCSNVDIENIPCTNEERAMIKAQLESGVYIK